ncbi:MAG: hypothetical protein ACREXT_14355, partial [Gammaproteobacteria bacterium]
ALALIAVGHVQAWNHLLGDDLAGAAPAAKHHVRLTLQGRNDLPKHLLVSAALASNADTAVADVVGVYKEVKDSQGGSGFSFVDLTADRAGVRLADKAVNAPRGLQRAIAGIGKESDLIPPTKDLAEGLQAAEFERRYRDFDSAEYKRVIALIERRLDRLPLYQ